MRKHAAPDWNTRTSGQVRTNIAVEEPLRKDWPVFAIDVQHLVLDIPKHRSAQELPHLLAAGVRRRDRQCTIFNTF